MSSGHGGSLRSRPEPPQGGSRLDTDTTVAAVERGGSGILERLATLAGAPLSWQQLEGLKEHRYSSTGKSLLEPCLQRFWCWLVARLPLWMAPNLITIVGLATNAITTLILVYHCPTATEQAPTWAYLACALGLFIYQSLDAIDGKQARRTNSSTPLGELFDHGCDSLSTVFVVLGTCITVQLGSHPEWMFFCCFAGIFMFYSAHWQAYVSGTLRFGIIDVTEVQIYIIVLYLLSAAGGTAFWQYVIPVLNIQMKIIPAVCTLLGAIFSCTNYFRVIFAGGMGQNGSTVAGTSVLSPAFHIGMVIALALAAYRTSPEQLFQAHPCLFVLMFGCISAKLTNKLVVAHMTRSELGGLDVAFVSPLLLLLSPYVCDIIRPSLLLWVALGLSGSDLVCYCVSVCKQIATHLHIRVFHLEKKEPSMSKQDCVNHH